MIRNFLLITFRNFERNKVFVLINVFGLGIALACCIVSYYNNKYHNDFDGFHSKRESLYKVGITHMVNDIDYRYGITPLSLSSSLGSSVSDIAQVVRVTHNMVPVRYGDHIFRKRMVYADTNFLDVFDFELIAGKIESFKESGQVMITLEFAQICFGDGDPLGKMIKVYTSEGKERSFIVSGILKDIPGNSSIQLDLLCNMNNYIDIHSIEENDWSDWVAATFLLVDDASKIEGITQQLQRFVSVQNDMRKDWKVSSFFIEEFKEVPTTGRTYQSNWLFSGLHPAQRIAPPVMAILLLLLACLNFTNTSLAISSRRLKEIGVRKVFGGGRMQTMIQFLGENLVLCFVALLVSIAIGFFLIDAYSSMWPYMDLKISFSDVVFWLFMVGLLIVTGLAAGSYPSFYVSRFNPINILKGEIRYGGSTLFSKVLLVFQFLLAISGIVCAVIFTQNAYFQENLNQGYEKDNVIAIPISGTGKLDGLRNAISQNPLITSIGATENHIGWGSYNTMIKWGEEEEHKAQAYDVGRGYLETMGLNLIEGAFFDEEFKESDRGKAIVVNEKFLRDFGWELGVGRKVRENDTIELTIVGVVKDFYPFGFWSKISPAIIKLGKKEDMRMLVVGSDAENLEKLNQYIQSQWETEIPNAVYPGFLQSELLSEAKDINKQIRNIFFFLAIVAVILSFVGLYTLVSLKIIKKTREIGIRKVLGAPLLNLVKLINREFLIILLIASVAGSILGYYLAEELLNSIWTIYMDISISSFLIPIVLVFIVATLVLSGKVYRAAIKNPVDSIKYE